MGISRYHEIIAVVASEKNREKRIQLKAFCSALTNVIKSPLRIILLPQVLEAAAGSASPLPQTHVSRGRETLKPALAPQKPRIGGPGEGQDTTIICPGHLQGFLKRNA